MPNSFKEVDKGYEDFLESIEDAQAMEVTIGVHSSDNSQSDNGNINMATLMSIHEFGTDRIPPRPALREGVRQNKDRIARISKSAIKQALSGRLDMRRAFNLMGEEAKGGVQSVFGDSSVLKGNAPATILQKGSESPLIDTGQLRASIDYQVND